MQRFPPALVALALLVVACTTGADGSAGRDDPAPDGGTRADRVDLPVIDLAPRVGPYQLTVESAPDPVQAGDVLVAMVDGQPVGRATVVDDGSAVLRDLPPGPVEVVLEREGEPLARTGTIGVGGGGEVDPSLYPGYAHDDIELEPGFNYVPTRDGTTLSAFVSLPGSPEDGPYPTLVEYSGYAPSRPDGNDPGRLVADALGYALVQVNVRGTGCSGGSFDAFEPVQGVDGYDVIEAVAAQVWSGEVGMYGISYAGIMQLHVAATRPPSLAAIAPLSVIADIASVVNPGGIYNNGFAESWTREVGDGAAAFGQGWEQDRVDGGDAVCADNQRLRVHNPDLIGRLQTSPFADELVRSRSPITTADAIEVPVFLAGAWQDEQTGSDWPALISELRAAPTVRVTMYNGLHSDAIGPELLGALVEFYDLHLDDPTPGADLLTRFGLSAAMSAVFGETLTIPFRSIDPADRDSLVAAYADDRPIRVLLESGADAPNLPVPSFGLAFTQWPPPEIEPLVLAVHPGEGGGLTLAEAAPAAPGAAAFTTDPTEGSVVTAPDPGRIWTNDPGWVWPRPSTDNGVVMVGPPLAEDLVVVGPASADLWMSADADDGDVEVTIVEVGPDGSETYVQAGWLRLSHRALDDEASSPLRPVISRRADDLAPLTPGGDPVLARVEIPPFGHVFRAGSRVGLQVDTPGASRPQWRFDVDPRPVTITVHTGPGAVSQLVLPSIGGVEVPLPRPRCGTLRGQPCRPASP